MDHLEKSARLYQGCGPTILRFGSLFMNGQPIVLGAQYQGGYPLQFGDSVPGHEISWVLVNGLLIADRCLLNYISWDDLNEKGLVFGRRVHIDNQYYLCRLLKVGENENFPNEWDEILTAAGDESDDLWHWHDAYFWGQESCHGHDNLRALRGFDSARLWSIDFSCSRSKLFGYRPVLEPLHEEHPSLSPGIRIVVYGKDSLIQGILVEETEYDLIIDCPSISGSCDFARKLIDGKIVLDKAGIQHISAI